MSAESDGSDNRWKLILALAIALASTAAFSAFMTLQWTEDDGVVDTDELRLFDEPMPDSARLDPPEPVMPSRRNRRLYEFPGHGGKLVTETPDHRADLPHLDADYLIDIRGDLATVIVRQTFVNDTDSVAEPIYEFPLYEEAAVYAMSMQIGDREVEAKIERREEARRQYERAREQGRNAALLDQDRPNLFTQRVANVDPGERVEITLRYTHPVPKTRGEYLMSVPLTVPDRYTPRDMSGNRLVDEDGASDPGSSPGGSSGGVENIDISMRIDGGMPVTGVTSPSHSVRIADLAETVRRVELVSSGSSADRHFRLNYRLSGDDTRIGLNSYWHDETQRGYFDMLIEPPNDIAAEQVTEREMVFVVDASGSMGARRMRAANDFVIRTLDHLRPSDDYRLIYFNDFVENRGEPMSATTENLRQTRSFVRHVNSGGGTEIVPALEAALQPPQQEDKLRMVVVVTDVKVSNDFEVIETITEHIGDARMFAVGLGGDVNRYLLEEIGRAGRGFSTQIGDDERMSPAVANAVRRLQNPVLTDISLDFGDLDVSGLTPDPVPGVYEGGSVRLHGRYHEPGTHTVEVEGLLGGERTSFERGFEFADSTNHGEAVRLAWARQRIADQMHQLNTPAELRADDRTDEEIRESITQLGLDYSLTTQWTSFIAVDKSTAEPTETESEASSNVINGQGPAPPDDSPDTSNPSGDALAVPSGSDTPSVITERRRERIERHPAPLSPGAENDGIDETDERVDNELDAENGSAYAAGRSDPREEPLSADLLDGFDSPDMLGLPDMDIRIDIVEANELDPDLLQRVLRHRRHSIDDCYRERLIREPDAHGSVQLRISVSPDGSITDATVQFEDVGGDVSSCLAENYESLSVMEPENGNSTTAEVEITLSTE